MHFTDLKGPYYEMGLEYGKKLKTAGFRLPNFTEKVLKLAKDCRNHVATIFPKILDELDGVAEAAELKSSKLEAQVLLHPQSLPKCSIFAVTDGEQTFLGRNYDMFYSLQEFTECYFTSPLDGYRSIGHTDIFIGREDGINEKGLGVAMSGITDYFKPGIAFWICIRYILDKCHTVQEGIDFLLDLPHHCTITFLLADPTGAMAVVEASPMQTEVRYSDDGFIISTNHLNHPKMRNIRLFEPPDSRTRYAAINNSLKNPPSTLDEKFLKSVLSGHDGLVCSHLNEIQLGTLWSMVANLNTRQIWRAEGHPCTVAYKDDNRLHSLCAK
ncbi:MAG: C45 family autoproteolytic acyltransferase/hydrolase [Candidatus Thorarchaeota archaeon]